MTKMVTRLNLKRQAGQGDEEAVLCLAVMPRFSDPAAGVYPGLPGSSKPLEFPLYWITNFSSPGSFDGAACRSVTPGGTGVPPASIQDGHKSGHKADRALRSDAEMPYAPRMEVQYSATSVSDQVTNEESLALSLAEVLADPLLEELWCAWPYERRHWADQWSKQGFRFWAERQYLPGVTDNLGRTVEEALQLSGFSQDVRVASGSGFLFNDNSKMFNERENIEQYCRFRHYHPVTDRFLVHDLKNEGSNKAKYLVFPAVHLPAPPEVKVIPLELPDSELEVLSRSRILALTLTEMKAIRAYYERPEAQQVRKSRGLTSWPTDVELEIIAQTWSEHCKHKIFNATIHHTQKKDGIDSQLTVKSLYKTFIQGPTKQLSVKRKDLLSVFKDNAGVVKWNDQWAICFKVETHNSPSALEPYGGALTGILGVNRDILGTGLGAKPILNTDVFCFAYPDPKLPQRPTMLPPESIIQGVRRGVQDGGNKSGIPTVNGAVYFHPGYRAKPLVFCGTAGILPLEIEGKLAYEKHTEIGDTIVMAGGRVGKDGIHGATFSSEALHEGSPISAVQIGDPFTQKRLLDFVIEARDAGLITGITDNGAGGLSSSVGEMATITGGATLELDDVPLKYPGLADYEIVISESQERMTLSTRHMEQLQKIADKHRVEITAVGKFNDRGYFEVLRHGKTVALLDLEFLHDGAPHMVLNSTWEPATKEENVGPASSDLSTSLLGLLSSPNICSREEIIRQYDHEVQGASVVKPLMGPKQQGPCDAAVIKPLFTENSGLVVSNGLCPQLSEYDCHLMAICAVDEAVRNAVCVGADPDTLSLLDNFCWTDPVQTQRNVEGSKKLGQLVRACQGLQEAVLAFEAPLISGKDSMKNDFDDGTIRLSVPPTLLISAIGRLPDIERAVTMEFKAASDEIYLLRAGSLGLAGSEYAAQQGWSSNALPGLDLQEAVKLYKSLHQAIMRGWIKSAHDLSEGGLAVALAECVIGSELGCVLALEAILESCDLHSCALVQTGESSRSGQDARAPREGLPPPEQSVHAIANRPDFALFGEGPGHIVITVSCDRKAEWEQHSKDLQCTHIGTVQTSKNLEIKDKAGKVHLSLSAETLAKHWKTPLPLD